MHEDGSSHTLHVLLHRRALRVWSLLVLRRKRAESEAQKRARRVWIAKRRAAGYVRMTVILHPWTLQRLAELAEVYGSRTAAIEALVLGYVEPEEGLSED